MVGASNNSTNTDVTIPVAHEDFEGREVSFRLNYIHNNAFRTAASASYVEEDGTLHLRFRNDRVGQIGVIRVDATIGTGETAITRSTYVFVKIQSDIDKVVVYNPMVFRVNPRTGGYSEAPTINADKSNFMISLKRNVFYYNLNGRHRTSATVRTCLGLLRRTALSIACGPPISAVPSKPVPAHRCPITN